jgi:hypothetical protein
MKTSIIILVSMLSILLFPSATHIFGQTKPATGDKASPYFTLQPHPGETLYYIGFRTVVISAPGLDHSVVSPSGSEAIFKILPGSTPNDLKMTTSARIEGQFQVEDAPYELSDRGDTECFQGKCYPERSASALVAKASIWGLPAGPLHAGMSWTVEVTHGWEFGPAGKQTIRVISVNEQDGSVILTRDGEGDGPPDPVSNTTVVTKGGQTYTVSVKHGHTHWSGKATIQHGFIISDECLADAEVELSSPEFGKVTGRERMFMALMQHPEAIPY